VLRHFVLQGRVSCLARRVMFNDGTVKTWWRSRWQTREELCIDAPASSARNESTQLGTHSNPLFAHTESGEDCIKDGFRYVDALQFSGNGVSNPELLGNHVRRGAGTRSDSIRPLEGAGYSA